MNKTYEMSFYKLINNKINLISHLNLMLLLTTALIVFTIISQYSIIYVNNWCHILSYVKKQHPGLALKN